jgi:Fe-S cluster biogenesis protein NfuA
MTEGGDLRHAGDRIEHLLEEIRSMASPPVWERVDALVRLIVQLYGTGLERIVEAVEAPEASVQTIRARFLKDELIASLLLLHGLSPEDLDTRVQKALERVRPYLGFHGGDVEVVSTDAEHGVVRLRMTGSCDGCPSSLFTVKLAVEGAIQEVAPEVTRIEVEGVTA